MNDNVSLDANPLDIIQFGRGYIFLSYVEEDRDVVEHLREFFRDKRYLYWDYKESQRFCATEAYSRVLEEAISNAFVLISVLTDNWCKDENRWPEREFSYAKETNVPRLIVKARELNKPRPIVIINYSYIDLVSNWDKGLRLLARELEWLKEKELLRKQEEMCRAVGNKDGLQRSLGNQALILQDRGDLDGAMRLHKEKERICRELGNKNGLSACLGNQALILQDRGDLDGAMRLLKEQERICRELGNPNGLAISLANQGELLANKLNRAKEAMPLAEEAYQIATRNGLTALAGQIRPILDKIRAL